MRILLARHGKTDNNAKGIFNDDNDIDLNEEGIAQAEKLSQRLKEEKIEVILSSNKKRALHTAEIVLRNQRKVKQVETMEEIRTRKMGELEGKPKELLKEYAAKRNVPDYLYRPANGGESFEDVYVRAKKAYDNIISKYKGKTVLVVAHKGFNRAFLAVASHIPMSEAAHLEQDNCCLNVLEVDKFRSARMVVFNDTTHLH
jgi:broad specificity phosphatase PhoE